MRVCHRCREEGGATTYCRCLVSVLTKRGINSIKQAYLYKTQILCTTGFALDPQMHRNFIYTAGSHRHGVRLSVTALSVRGKGTRDKALRIGKDACLGG